MRASILGVHDGRGVLLSEAGQRLEFPLSEWRSAGSPVAGQAVDFVEANGEASAVYAVPASAAPAGEHSSATVLGGVGVGCLALGFIIPLIPTIAAFVLGVIGASQARTENNETALILSRVAWIGALVWLIIGFVFVLAILSLIGTLGVAAIWHGQPPNF